MVSNIRYKSFKDLDLKGRVPFVWVLSVVLVFVFISTDPPLVLFSIFLLYALSGPVLTLKDIRAKRAARSRYSTFDKEKAGNEKEKQDLNDQD